MAEPADDLLDATTRHAVDIEAAKNEIANRAIAEVNESDEELLAVVLAAALAWREAPASARPAIRDQMRDDIEEITGEAFARSRDTLVTLAAALAASEVEFQAMMLEDSGLDPVEIDLPDEEVMRIAVDTSFAIGGSESGELPVDDHVEAVAERRVREVLAVTLAALAAEESLDVLAGSIRGTAPSFEDGALERSRRALDAVAQTYGAGITYEAALRVWEGENRVRYEYWNAILDSRTCPICRANSGATRRVGTTEWSNGYRGSFPAHVRDRCVIVPLPSSARPEDVTFREWIERQPAEVQDDVFGPSRRKLFREGRLDLQDFVTDRGRILTLDELRERNRSAFRRAGLDEVA